MSESELEQKQLGLRAPVLRRGSAKVWRVGGIILESRQGDLDSFKSDRVRSQTLGENQKWQPADKKTESNRKMNDAFRWEDSES